MEFGPQIHFHAGNTVVRSKFQCWCSQNGGSKVNFSAKWSKLRSSDLYEIYARNVTWCIKFKNIVIFAKLWPPQVILGSIDQISSPNVALYRVWLVSYNYRTLTSTSNSLAGLDISGFNCIFHWEAQFFIISRSRMSLEWAILMLLSLVRRMIRLQKAWC